MKKTNKLTAKILAVIMAMTCAVSSVSAVTMYAPDGRTADVKGEDVEAWKNVGWYTEPVTAVHSLDGREMYAPQSQLEAYKAVGWYTPVTMYAPDGRTEKVKIYDVEAWKAVGWYTEPVTAVHSLDGREMYAPQSQLEAYKAVGWYTPVTMYAPDGRTETVKIYDVAAWEAVGWATEPFVKMYATDGRVLSVVESQADAYTAVGWYKHGSNVTVYHPDQVVKNITASDLAHFIKNGWYTEPVARMYSLDKNPVIIPETQVQEYINAGWFKEGTDVKLYSPDGTTKTVTASEVKQWVAVGWYTVPVMTVYSSSWESRVIAKSELQSYLDSGWYESLNDIDYSAYCRDMIKSYYNASSNKDGFKISAVYAGVVEKEETNKTIKYLAVVLHISYGNSNSYYEYLGMYDLKAGVKTLDYVGYWKKKARLSFGLDSISAIQAQNFGLRILNNYKSLLRPYDGEKLLSQVK